MRMSTSTVHSFNAAAKDIYTAAQRLGRQFGPGLRMIGEEIMTDVKDARPGRGVPVDTGALRSSGRVEGPEGPPTAPKVALSFGGASAVYALIQHETLGFHHPVGEARYLVRGLERWKAGSSRAYLALKAGVRRSLRGKGKV